MSPIAQVDYPPQFPANEIQTVVNYLRNKDDVDLACAAKHAWNVVGFGMSFIPHDHPVMGMTEPQRLTITNAEMADKIEAVAPEMEGCEGDTLVGDAPQLPAWVLIALPLFREAFNRILDDLLRR